MNRVTTYLAAILSMSNVAYANQSVNGQVEDVYRNVTTSRPYTDTVCESVQTPIYRDVQEQGNAAGGALLGMIIGGALGDVVSEGNGNATAGGAIMGGLIGADRASQPRTRREIVGHRNDRVCNDVTRYRDVQTREYDYSILHFNLDGVAYQTQFIRN